MVKAYLVNAFKYGDSIYCNLKASFNRTNMTNVPESLDTSKIIRDNETLFLSRVGACISLIEMGDFENIKLAQEAYDNSKKEYKEAYDKFVSNHKKDSDWNMLLIVDESCGKPIIKNSMYISNKIGDEFYQFFNFIDACTIYESIFIIKNLLGDFKPKSKFSKFDLYKLEIYSETLDCFLKPESFYVNSEEINLIKEFYKLWEIESLCRICKDSIKSTTSLFDFTFKNEKEKREYLVSRMFSVLTLVLGFTTLYKEFSSIKSIKILLFVVFGIFACLLIFDIVKHLINIIIEKKEFKNKIHFGDIDKID